MADKKSRGRDPRQQELDLPAAEAARTERLNDLYVALMLVGADLHLVTLCVWVFNVTSGGLNGELQKSYEQLAASPRGLCCSRPKARSTVEWAIAERLLRLHVHRRHNGAQDANGLSIDWDGIRWIKQRPTRGKRGAPGEHGGAPGEHGGAPGEHGGALEKHLLKEHSSFSSLTPFSPPPSPPRRGAGGGLVLERKETPGPALAEVPDHVLAWQAIGRRLSALGVYADLVENLLARAASRGATPADVTALVDHFESRPQAWSAGALTIALKRWEPGLAYDAAALWPPPSDAYRKAAHREAAERLASAQAAEERNRRARLDQERQAAASVEARWGAELDALSEERLAALILCTPRAQNPVFELARKQRPIKGMLREVLLDALAKNAEEHG